MLSQGPCLWQSWTAAVLLQGLSRFLLLFGEFVFSPLFFPCGWVGSSHVSCPKLDAQIFLYSVAGTLGVPALNGAAPAQMSMPIGGATAFPNMLPTQVIAAMAPEPIGIPSECLLLKNMFDPATEVHIPVEFHI